MNIDNDYDNDGNNLDSALLMCEALKAYAQDNKTVRIVTSVWLSKKGKKFNFDELMVWKDNKSLDNYVQPKNWLHRLAIKLLK